MWPNLPFLSAASNALLKPGGLLRRKKRLVKDARLLLPLTEVMKIARLTFPLLDAPRQSLLRPRLRHGRRLDLLFHLNLTLNLCTLFFALSLALLPRLPPLLTSPTVLLSGNWLRSMPLTCNPTFPFLSQRRQLFFYQGIGFGLCRLPAIPLFRFSAKGANCSSIRELASVYAAYLQSHFSVSQPKALRSRARGYLSELRRATYLEKSHLSFCSPFSLAQFLAAASNLSSSTATGPDKVAYPMLKHLPRSGMDFLLHIFNLSWYLHSFPSIWKTFSIIPIHKMGKSLDSPPSLPPLSLTFCVSKLFERIILSPLFFFLESSSILSPRQAGFRPGRSTLDQILYLSQSISDGFTKPRPGSWTILPTIDFSKAFDSIWHPTLFHKLISTGLPPCFARWTQSFLSARRFCVVLQNHKSRSFRVGRGVPQGSVHGPVLFSLFINDLPASLPSSVSCSLYADDLAI